MSKEHTTYTEELLRSILIELEQLRSEIRDCNNYPRQVEIVEKRRY